MDFQLLVQDNIIVKEKIIIKLSYDYIQKNLEPVEDLNEIYKNYFDKLGNRLLRTIPDSDILNSFI